MLDLDASTSNDLPKSLRVILATGNAADLAFRNPDAIVIDHGCHAIWVYERRIDFSGAAGRSQLFRFCTALCCTQDGVLFRHDLIEMLWGDDPDGGPLETSQIISHLLRKALPFMALVGLEAITMRAPSRIVLVYRRPKAPRGQGGLYIGHHGARPVEARA